MAFIGTLKEDFLAEINEETKISLKKGEEYKILDQTSLFYLLNLGLATPIAVRKGIIVKSGTGVEWYSNSFDELYQDKTSFKKRFRMHIADEKERFTYEINMRFLNDKWEFTEFNQYTNGTDANKIGLVEDEGIKKMLMNLLEEDEKFTVMMKETMKQKEIIEKVKNSDFEMEDIVWKEDMWSKRIAKVKIILKGISEYWFRLDYDTETKEIDYIYLVSEKTMFNLKNYLKDGLKEKIITRPEIEGIKLSKIS